MTDGDHVLYVDGDADQRERVGSRLRAAGYAVTAVPDADTAVDVLDGDDVDGVVSEYRLPDGDGLTFFERIQTRYPRVPFVVYTAHGSETLAGEAVAAGVDGYVPKSAGPETLVDHLDRALLLGERGVLRAGADTPVGSPSPDRILASLDDAVYALDPEGRFTSVDGRLVEASGYTREELLGAHASTVIDGDDVVEVRDRIESAVEDGRPASFSTKVEAVDKDGSPTPCELSASALFEDGEFAGTVGVVRDVSERKRMERRLREGKKAIESLHRTASRLGECETAPEVYATTVEAAERVLSTDGCSIHVLDPSGSTLVSHTWTGTDDPRTYTAPFSVEGSIQGETVGGDETRRIDDCRGDGPDLGPYRSLLLIPLRDRELFQAVSTDPGAFSEDDVELAEILLAHGADALERVDFEGQLVTERDRFAALFENVPDPVVDADHDEAGEPVVQAVNGAFERVFGYDEEEVVGRRLDEVVVPKTPEAREEAREINDQIGGGDPIEREVQRRTADGLRTFLLTVVPVEEGGSTRRFALYTDVTERKQRRQRLKVLNRVLRHDLRNNLNVILTATGALSNHVDDAGREFLSIVEDNADDLIALAEGTRTIERTLDADDSGTEAVDVVAETRDAVESVRERFPEADIAVEAPARAPARADEDVDIAIEHVVENAVEHNDREEPTVRVTVDPDPVPEAVSVRVADDGPGIPDAERELLVEGREITQLRHASGLGLWLVNWLVTQAGGDLDIEDNDPRGTVVTIRLPEEGVDPAREGAADPGLDDERDGTREGDPIPGDDPGAVDGE